MPSDKFVFTLFQVDRCDGKWWGWYYHKGHGDICIEIPYVGGAVVGDQVHVYNGKVKLIKVVDRRKNHGRMDVALSTMQQEETLQEGQD